MLAKLNKLEQTAGRNDKLALLEKYLAAKDGDQFWTLCNYALNPFINFGCRSFPKYDKGTGKLDLASLEVYNVLDTLANSNHSNATTDLIVNTIGQLTPEDQEVFQRIVLKDLRCGVQIASFNTAVKKCNENNNTSWKEIVDYPCMLTAAYSDKLFNKFKWGEQTIYCQEKCDGMRFNAIVDRENDKVEYFGRSGKPLTIPDLEFKEEFLELAEVINETIPGKVVFDGELLIERCGIIQDRKTGNGILNKAVRGTIGWDESQYIVARLWDVIPYEHFLAGKQPNKPENVYSKRWGLLTFGYDNTTVDRIRCVECREVGCKELAFEMFNEMLEQGKEGVIVKSGDNIWKDTRVNDCVKLKQELDADLVVVGLERGTGRFSGTLGSLICESSDGLVRVGVGTGFTEQERAELWDERKTLVGKIITVTYNMRISDKNKNIDSLFLPRFVEVREDKKTANGSKEIK